jgi:hypothetical protein
LLLHIPLIWNLVRPFSCVTFIALGSVQRLSRVSTGRMTSAFLGWERNSVEVHLCQLFKCDPRARLTVGVSRAHPLRRARPASVTESAVSMTLWFKAQGWASVPRRVRQLQRRFSGQSMPGTFLAQCMNLPLVPKLPNWPISHRYPYAQGDQKLLEACCRQDSSRNHSALCPFQWSTWPQNIHPRTRFPGLLDILGNWFFPSMHKPRRKRHIAQ